MTGLFHNCSYSIDLQISTVKSLSFTFSFYTVLYSEHGSDNTDMHKTVEKFWLEIEYEIQKNQFPHFFIQYHSFFFFWIFIYDFAGSFYCVNSDIIINPNHNANCWVSQRKYNMVFAFICGTKLPTG